MGHSVTCLSTSGADQSIDWSAPDVDNRVNQVARRMALQALLDYINGGNTALGVYRDKSHPAAVAGTLRVADKAAKRTSKDFLGNQYLLNAKFTSSQ